jgi:surface polysaccharide O-acyltransferase-like enzyme
LPQQEWYSYFHIFFREGGHAGYYADDPTMGWLWFLPVLFMFQLVYLLLAKSNFLKFRISLRTGVILTFIIGLGYSMLISSLDMTGWYHSPVLHFQRERLLVYFMVFLLGTLCYKMRVFDTGRLSKKWYIISNVVLSVSLAIFTVVALNLFFNLVEPGRNYYFISETIDRIAYYSTMLTSMLSFLHIFIYSFQAYLNKSNRLMDQLNRNSYGVYIIHMVVVGLIALPMLSISLPAIVKYLILAVLTFTISNMLVYAYRFLIKAIVKSSTEHRGMVADTRNDN